jgi:hypothetical protein
MRYGLFGRCIMKDIDIKQRLDLLRKEVEAAVSLLKETKSDFAATIESLNIEIEVLKLFLERQHSDFAVFYPRLRQEARMRRRSAIR